MTTRREAIAGLLGAAAALPLTGVLAASVGRTPVKTATFERPAAPKEPPPYVPSGIYRVKPDDTGYVQEEWFLSGVDDSGQAYKTQVIVWRPRDRAKFSGTIIVEPLHAQGAPPIFMYTGPYIVRSGHGWACVGSQKAPLDAHVKPKDPAYYASLHIEAAPGTPPAPQPGGAPPDPAAAAARQGQVNQASNAILAQAGAALRSGKGPFAAYKVRRILLAGHSQTGGVVTNYVLNQHNKVGLAGARPIYDGFFPSGSPRLPFPPRDVPLIQVVSDGDVSDAEARGPEFAGRKYRRPDSDDPNDRFRLYELAGVPHMGTRYPPHNNPANWKDVLGQTDGVIMNSLPHHEQFSMGLHHLVQWVARGVTPPRAPRLEVAAGGRYLAKDGHGNTLGGIRSAQMDVPRATYYPNPVNTDGTPKRGVVGIEKPFDAATMRALYETPANYARRFNRRVDELVAQGWLLPADASTMRAEANAQRF